MINNIGFISTRFAGTDGVSLESQKWADYFTRSGHACYWFAGELDRPRSCSFLVPEAHFQDPLNQWLTERVFGRNHRTANVTRFIQWMRSFLKQQLEIFVRRFEIDLLIAENVLAIPMHIPLGLALKDLIAETRLPTIAHHHDFCWERSRFEVNAVEDYLEEAFPPRLPTIQHVVINSQARIDLVRRTGSLSSVIPNVLDYAQPLPRRRHSTPKLRQALGLASDDRIILQPTRVVPRKGIEHAIDLVKALNDPRLKLVLSHSAGDEGFNYLNGLKRYARHSRVDMRVVPFPIDDPWRNNGNGNRFDLWDVYREADFVTFPSLYEGFGNAFLEAVYCRKPVLINRYDAFVQEIEPKGFDLVVMDGRVGPKQVKHVRALLNSPRLRHRMTATNYAVAKHHFSYSVLAAKLGNYVRTAMGWPVDSLGSYAVSDSDCNTGQESARVIPFPSGRGMLRRSGSSRRST